MLAISTAWNVERLGGWGAAVSELVGLDRTSVALDGPALYPDVPAARAALAPVRGEVVALFAPAPRPDRERPGASMGIASPRTEERALAAQAALAAAAAAAAAGTGVVVLRTGGIPSVGDDSGDWRRRLAREGVTDELTREVFTAMERDAAHRERFLDGVCRTLHGLSTRLPDVTWLLETPAEVPGFPGPSEIAAVLEDLSGRRLGYWHDTGNAAYLHALGVADAEGWLQELGGRTLGVTLSDWSPSGGGLPPGAGVVDWTGLRVQLVGRMQRVLRLDPAFPPMLLADAIGETDALGLL